MTMVRRRDVLILGNGYSLTGWQNDVQGVAAAIKPPR
jgi:hypothetical protein